jgi:hypothetical protein
LICEEHRVESWHCICDNAYNESKIMLMCDNCLMWFHGKCIGFKTKDVNELKYYTCTKCKEWAI